MDDKEWIEQNQAMDSKAFFSSIKLNPSIQVDFTQNFNPASLFPKQDQKMLNLTNYYDFCLLSDIHNIKAFEQELADNQPKPVQSGIKYSFSMNIGFTKQGQRYMGILLVFDKKNNTFPIGFACFSLFLMDSWQVHGVENSQQGIGLCCYLNYTFIKPLHRKQGIAVKLSQGLAQIFFDQLIHINNQIAATELTLTPIIYQGTYAAGGNFLLTNIEQSINRACASEQIGLCPCISNT